MTKAKAAKRAKATDTEKEKAKDGEDTNFKAETKGKTEETHNRKTTTLTTKQKQLRQTRLTLSSSKAIAITVASGATLAETATRDWQMRHTHQKKPPQTHLSKLPLLVTTKLRRCSTTHSSPTTPTPKVTLQTKNKRQVLAKTILNVKYATPTKTLMHKTMKHTVYTQRSKPRKKRHHLLL
jgi:hypothetical protein